MTLKKISGIMMALIPLLFLSFAGCEDEPPAPPPQVAKKKKPATKPGAKAVAVPKKEEALAEKKEIKYIYDPSGKRDPFQPSAEYLIDDPVVGGHPPDDNGDPWEPTPPEMFELSQLKLVAVMHLPKKSVAMVEDPEGKGHTIYVGSYIGKNRGQVVKIEQNKLFVEEKARTLAGTYKTTTHELVIEAREGG